MCSPGMLGARAGSMCVFLSDRVELCLAGRWESRLMIIQEGGIYLVVESQFSLDKKTGFPEEEKVVWGSQGEKKKCFFSLHCFA